MQPPAQTSIAARVAAIRSEVVLACERAARDPRDVTLIGITKTFTVDDIAEALGAGLDDFGENRAQELLPKVHEAHSRSLAPRWHFVGHLQRNKVRDVLPHIAALHSLDSARLAAEIEQEGARQQTTPLRCYIEVNVAGEDTKQGLTPDEVSALLETVAACPHIEVAGLMTVAPHVSDPEHVRPVFRALRELASAHGLQGLSMGMSEDYTVAVEEGATAIRVGRALFGPRP
jgi:pyridoxal phosphate enzyme (YggS family)